MAKSWSKRTALAVSGVALLALTGCGGGSPDDGYSGPPASSYDQGGQPGELMGGTRAPPRDNSGLAGGPSGYGGMAAIPNPENLPLAERQRIYGHKYDNLRYRPLGGDARPARGRGDRAGAPLRSWRDANGKLVVAMRPIANPEDMSVAERRRVYGKRYAPRAYSAPAVRRREAPRASYPVYKPTPKPAAPAYRSAPKAVAPPPRIVAKPAPAPVRAAPPVVAKAAPLPPAPKLSPPALKIPPVAAPVAVKPVGDAKLAQLSAAVSPEALKGATLTVPATLAQGQESEVTLALPVDLLDVIQREAAKLGLTKAARKAEVSATLTGEGYTITPNAAQTQSLKKGEAAVFNWQVKPEAGEKTPLKATVEGALKGQRGAAKTFSVASLEEVVAEVVETAKSQASKLGLPSLDKLAIPGIKPIKIGGTVIPPGATTAGILVFLIGLILLAMGRAGSARRARAERRRKFRTMTDYGRVETDADPEPEPSHHNAVNPMLAAAGGFAAGAMTFGHHDDDHGRTEDHAPQAETHAEHPAPVEHADEHHGETAHAEHAVEAGPAHTAHAEDGHHAEAAPHREHEPA
jgi:hypothetical protein